MTFRGAKSRLGRYSIHSVRMSYSVMNVQRLNPIKRGLRAHREPLQEEPAVTNSKTPQYHVKEDEVVTSIDDHHSSNCGELECEYGLSEPTF